jgi:hypothetical protein
MVGNNIPTKARDSQVEFRVGGGGTSLAACAVGERESLGNSMVRFRVLNCARLFPTVRRRELPSGRYSIPGAERAEVKLECIGL